ncbi:hypothetical protein [Phaeobacter sp. HF9A]|uniref:hypothetical protein n=1 Tax=Phaeobacter sp. HF9A TaxID=2721561 RepID=UPI00143007BC|nr:hypothetical protein [Phaeobacter sp. HF9A]NIZ13390.1 hypothetical protein [Phaeobacter sp. HF9A]
MQRFLSSTTAALMLAGWTSAAMAQSVCDGEVLFQCATDNADFREQITVCAQERSYSLTRHALSSGEMYYDTPLIADADTTWFRWSEGDQAQVEIGFWSTDLAEPVTLHVDLPWDDVNETVADTGAYDMWLQSPHWRARVDQTLCASGTVYAAPEGLWPPQNARGPIGTFFSQDEIIPRVDTVGVARVSDTVGVARVTDTVGVARVTDTETSPEGVPVYSSARPSAATPIWWMLQPGETVDIIDRENDFIAVAIPTNGLSGCVLRPEDLGKPYTGPCATGWVDGVYLQKIQ